MRIYEALRPAVAAKATFCTCPSLASSTIMADESPIPQPPPHWLLGNMKDLDSSQMMLSLMKLWKLYGPIYRTDIGGIRFIRLCTQELVHEVCDDERFEKQSVPCKPDP